MPNYNLKDDFEKTFGVPVIVHANASIIALSEYYYGKRERVESMIAYLIRGGVGGSYINRGQVFESQGRSTFGLGHMMIANNQDDPLLPRMQYLQDMINENILIDLASKVDPGINDIQSLDHALSLRRQDVIDALKKPVNMLALSVISLSNIINPDSFVFVTRSNHLSAFLAEEVKNIHKGNRFASKGIETEFYGAPYLPQQFCKGSILLVLKAFFAGALGPLNKYSSEHEVALVDEH
jgi:predicted NBD/HSP70 family sugar kinase